MKQPTTNYQSQEQMVPTAQGLYDPRWERDACGMGFVVDVKGRKSHDIVAQALTVLANLTHRGASGSEVNTGDGAGIMIQLPHTFLQRVCTELAISLPEIGYYGVGMLFMSQDPTERQEAQAIWARVVAEEGQQLLGWRDVPTDNRDLGETSALAEPFVRQCFIGQADGFDNSDPLNFERKLYIIRKRIEQELPTHLRCYIVSLSARTLTYKGMLLSEQLPLYYPDLSAPDMETALALVHSRFSTNTFPSWERAHPYRFLIHNGEINTLRGNENWMKARQSMFRSEAFGREVKRILPIIDPSGSDTAKFDNCLEFLTLAGRPLPQVVMMMIPEPWSKHQQMDETKRAFYEYHSCLMEPWDGPASIGFTDGVRVGAVLDRNGLRPSRYYVTKDDRVIMASEVGVLDVSPAQVRYKGRLQPGRMFLVDTEEGRIISDEEIKQKYATEQPYQQWLKENMITVEDLPAPYQKESQQVFALTGAGMMAERGSGVGRLKGIPQIFGVRETAHPEPTTLQRQQAFGYTFEDLRVILAPMAQKGVEPIGSMGDDTPLAVLSHKPQPLYNYFKQLFAQVTNPPLDAIREELVTSTETWLGAEGNLLQPAPRHARRIKLPHPILTNAQLTRLRQVNKYTHLQVRGFKSAVLPTLYAVDGDGATLNKAMTTLCRAADRAITEGANLLILSDQDINYEKGAIPTLLAIAGLHHHLVQQGTRTRVSLIVESGEPREVHHFAVLLGYGADAINPYLALETMQDLIDREMIDVDYETAVNKYIKAVVKGVVKVMSKMGISTVQSYRGAQIYEAVGLRQSVVDQYFTGTSSRIEGVGMETLAEEVFIRHRYAFPDRRVERQTLPEGGRFQWREDGEHHLFSPSTIHSLQTAVRTGSYKHYLKYAQDVNDQSQKLFTLRGLMDFKFVNEPVPLDEVESVDAICRRFKTGAMSYGSISKEAHESLAIAMNRIGGKSNTGEGGEDRARFTPDDNGDSRNSAIKQVASGRFGVTSEYLVNAEEIQIKMAQGAKPGEGGQLPGHKVYPWIAEVRHSTPGVGLISPPPHHDIYSIEDLAQLIHDLKNANPRARINVKLVSEVGVGTIAAGVAKGHADVILISGHDGGTGASPQTSIKHAGLPWELGLAETHQTLLLNKLRDRVVLETDGQLKTGRDVVIGALLGAEEFGFATAPLVALGCIMMRVCHLNTCPVGIATQDPALRAQFNGDPAHAVNFMRFIAQDVRELMAQLGFRTFDEMIGRTDKLEMRTAVTHWKAHGLDLSKILYQPDMPETVGRYGRIAQDHGLDKALDRTLLLDLCKPALDKKQPVYASLPIRNINRVVGTMLGSEVSRRYGAEGLPEDTIQLRFRGSAGQSFGAFVPNGMTLMLEGDANDYLGKGLSGGKVIVYPSEGTTFVPEDNVIIGNVAFYGATGGEAYINGVAGERFCVRNSGVRAVVEAVGDHGCEYMTGGRVIILGPTGRNFAAGMSGGVAYVWDEMGDFHTRCNQDMVWLEVLEEAAEIEDVRQMIEKHAQYTGSNRARTLLAQWEDAWPQFVKVMPKDYKRMVTAFQEMQASGLSGDEAIMAAFEANKRAKARTTGL